MQKASRLIQLAKIYRICILVIFLIPPVAVAAEDQVDAMVTRDIRILQIASPYEGGYGYRIEYRLPVPIDVCWRFKTDFENDFLLRNSLIASHRLLRRQGNVAITETTYRAAPGKRFIWETITDPRRHRMDFRLIDPGAAGQQFHEGVIRLIDQGSHTVIVQQAFFNFRGAGLWVHYPFRGGMREILTTTARWEQKTIGRLQAAYR
jgi:hypothetical protein